jgi:hypothetical protein
MSASTDVRQFLKGLAQAEQRSKDAARKALDQFGEHVLGDAQQLTPVDTGALKASGYTEPVTVDAGGEMAKPIGFNTSYAAAVHERLDVHHDQGQAKFLETAIRNNQPKLAPFIADRVKKALG